MNRRQEIILNFINAQKLVSTSDIHQHVINATRESIARITIIRDVDYLFGKKMITRKGRASAVKYSPAIANVLLEYFNIEEYFQKDCDDRAIKHKNFYFGVFEHLSSPLFTELELGEIHLLNGQFQQKYKKLTSSAIKKEFERLTVEFSWKSSRIEGNTYSLLDTERLIKENVEAAGHTKEESTMILNHKHVLDYVFQNPYYYKEITLAKIEDLHRLLAENLDISLGLRSSLVGIIGTNYRPLDNFHQIREAMNKLVDIINELRNPFEKALVAVLMTSYVQPFEDGNKRTSRILGNALLLAHDCCPLSYRSVDEIEYKKAVIMFYEQNSVLYFKQLFVEQFRQAVERYF
jgi:hypothetical protein